MQSFFLQAPSGLGTRHRACPKQRSITERRGRKSMGRSFSEPSGWFSADVAVPCWPLCFPVWVSVSLA
jgi:hypothetical protein